MYSYPTEKTKTSKTFLVKDLFIKFSHIFKVNMKHNNAQLLHAQINFKLLDLLIIFSSFSFNIKCLCSPHLTFANSSLRRESTVKPTRLYISYKSCTLPRFSSQRLFFHLLRSLRQRRKTPADPQRRKIMVDSLV